MSNISEASLSTLLSTIPASGTTAVIVVLTSCFVVVLLRHCVSPVRLTRVLIDAITVTENTYFEGLETGLLGASDVVCIGPLLSSLQLKVSKIRDETLENSRSNWKEVCGFFQGRSITIFHYIREVRDLETHIEILKEAQLRGENSNPLAMRAVSLRRRCAGRRGTYA
ncbi:hypothetical protein DFH06DRAFT_1416252 [Mycena polygramma]|nr:hypothetical protein DFH06DRAFT_1416252 [Mycena polygramma]